MQEEEQSQGRLQVYRKLMKYFLTLQAETSLVSIFLFFTLSWNDLFMCALPDSELLKGTTWILLMNDEVFIIPEGGGGSEDWRVACFVGKWKGQEDSQAENTSSLAWQAWVWIVAPSFEALGFWASYINLLKT